MLPPTWLNCLALVTCLGGAICVAVKYPLNLFHSHFDPGLIVIPFLLGFSAYRVRPRPEFPGLFNLLLAPVAASGPVFFVWAVVTFHPGTTPWHPRGIRAGMEDLLGWIVFHCPLCLLPLAILLRAYAHRTGLLLAVVVVAAVWSALFVVAVLWMLRDLSGLMVPGSF